MNQLADLIGLVSFLLKKISESDTACRRLETQLINCSGEMESLEQRLRDTEKAKHKLEKALSRSESRSEGKADALEPRHDEVQSKADESASAWERRWREVQERCLAAEARLEAMKPQEETEILAKVIDIIGF